MSITTQIPIYLGASASLITSSDAPSSDQPPYHGLDGLGDVHPALPADHPDALAAIDRTEHAVNALHRLAADGQRRGDPITLVCLAPLTNLALAVRMYGAAFVRSVGQLWLMGGNHLGIGNMGARVCAEFNFHADPEAAHIVLEAFGAAGVPVVVLPWEACTARSMATWPLRWRWDVLGAVEHPVVAWLNPIERSIFGKEECDDVAAKQPTYCICDALLVGCLLWPERLIGRVKRRRCTVELLGVHTRGQMVVDRVNGGQSRVPENVWLLEQLVVDECKELMLWTVDAATTVRWQQPQPLAAANSRDG